MQKTKRHFENHKENPSHLTFQIRDATFTARRGRRYLLLLRRRAQLRLENRRCRRGRRHLRVLRDDRKGPGGRRRYVHVLRLPFYRFGGRLLRGGVRDGLDADDERLGSQFDAFIILRFVWVHWFRRVRADCSTEY